MEKILESPVCNKCFVLTNLPLPRHWSLEAQNEPDTLTSLIYSQAKKKKKRKKRLYRLNLSKSPNCRIFQTLFCKDRIRKCRRRHCGWHTLPGLALFGFIPSRESSVLWVLLYLLVSFITLALVTALAFLVEYFLCFLSLNFY